MFCKCWTLLFVNLLWVKQELRNYISVFKIAVKKLKMTSVVSNQWQRRKSEAKYYRRSLSHFQRSYWWSGTLMGSCRHLFQCLRNESCDKKCISKFLNCGQKLRRVKFAQDFLKKSSLNNPGLLNGLDNRWRKMNLWI